MCATSPSLRSRSPRSRWTPQTKDTRPLSTSPWSLTLILRKRSPVAPAEVVARDRQRARVRASQRARARGRTSQRAKVRGKEKARMSPRARARGKEKEKGRTTSPKARARARARERARTTMSPRARGRARAVIRERRVPARRAGTTTMIPTPPLARGASPAESPRASLRSHMMTGATVAGTRVAKARVAREREAARAGTTEVLLSRGRMTLGGRGLNFLISCRHPEIHEVLGIGI
mmetsp:Transcript_15723/g.28635  ORF Transcript_15723/g.28635 Transcript_15723/m.28635 type:complete len:235 (+) Transcript_15723:384-1088(+)